MQIRVFRAILLYCLICKSLMLRGKSNKTLDPSNDKNLPSLLKSVECGYDIRNLCSKQNLTDNLEIIKCLQRDEVLPSITDDCDHYLWTYKLEMNRDPVTLSLARNFCSKEEKILNLCHFKKVPTTESMKSSGDFLGCLLSEKLHMKTESCRIFVNKIASIVFSDYRLVKPLLSACETYIRQYNCGRIPLNSHVNSTEQSSVRSPTSQGRSIDCLVNHLSTLNKTCNQQILRLFELQSDDYHLDRRLYFACREERERICGQLKAGNGKVYSCLTSNKFHSLMSKTCADQLTKRQSLSQADYKLNHGFTVACNEDLERLQCTSRFNSRRSDLDQTIGISVAIGCLKDAKMKEKSDDKLSPDCQISIREITKQLMQDYKVNPEIVTHCQNEIKSYCSNEQSGLERNGKTIHCLMKLHQPDPRESRVSLLSDNCYQQIKGLIQISDPVSDIQVDESVWYACRSIRNTYCQTDTDAPRMYSCIQRHLNSSIISKECKQRFLEVAYIVSRDFRLDSTLYKLCQKDAEKFCNASTNWLVTGSPRTPDTQNRGRHVFTCLFKHTLSSSDKNLGSKCAAAVHGVLQERSNRVKLEPLLYEPCLKDLSELCMNKSRYQNNELLCLEDYYDKLTIDCQLAIRIYASEEDRDYRLNPSITGPCGKYINQFCATSELFQVMPCLIKNKQNEKMGRECRISIIQYQQRKNQDYRLSASFYHICGDVVNDLCPSMKNRVVSMNAALDCITNYLDNQTDPVQPGALINKKCKEAYEEQMRLRFGWSSPDDDLTDVCLVDLESHCSRTDSGMAKKIQCLKNFQTYLTDACHQFLFRKEISNQETNRVDYALSSLCENEIKRHCSHVKNLRDELLHCLRNAQLKRARKHFDDSCTRTILNQLEINSRDYKMDRPFEKACRLDIQTHCQEIVDKYSEKDKSYDGKVKSCIKEIYLNGRASKNKGLSERCKAAVRSVIVDTNLNYRLMPRFRDACSQELTDYCLPHLEESMDEEAQRTATECLLEKIKEGTIVNKDCLREASHSMLLIKKADVSADPELSRVCSRELASFCSSVEPGDGRQMDCLLKLRDHPTKSRKLGMTCKVQLKIRSDLYSKVLHANPQTFSELANQIASSSINHHILIACVLSLFLMFFLGIFIGCRGCWRNRKDVNYSRLKQSV